MESLIRHSCFVNKSVFQRCIIKASVNIFVQSYFHRGLVCAIYNSKMPSVFSRKLAKKDF